MQLTDDQRRTDIERAENLARLLRVFTGELGLTGHLATWAESGDTGPLVADIDTLTSTLADLRDLVTGGAR